MDSKQAREQSEEALSNSCPSQNIEDVLYQINFESIKGLKFTKIYNLTSDNILKLLDLGFLLSKRLDKDNIPYTLIQW